ncbi:glycosyltransferase family A protein [Thermosynechococcaceae cyanobacterium BACA0444]|uniref:Glycosyltransferase family A protein n=1 Tax=Pseudocalidococcus azoricus BACA0444 TaxID=2918990 RepID=A0AAE4FUJ9_9CYAN|nr:glycosyltransferase family A protein [Pseudocalidococcus azoricus]MDS3861160.1 glycosyltransferase family A protein [Pseudocalidococcus azoricus BACA0444]
MTLPLISVIIPVYNGEHFLAEALASIHAQNYDPLELIVVDDGSMDNSAEIAKADSRVRYFYQENQGQAVARNNGIIQAKGDLITFLDQDDVWPKGSLINLVEILQKMPDVALVHGLVQEYNYCLDDSKFYISDRIPYWHVNLGSALFRKSIFFKVGLLSDGLKGCDDIEWFMRAWYQEVPNYSLEKVTLHYRRHDNNMTWDTITIKKGIMRVYYEHIQYNRQNLQLSHNKQSFLEYIGFNKYFKNNQKK